MRLHRILSTTATALLSLPALAAVAQTQEQIGDTSMTYEQRFQLEKDKTGKTDGLRLGQVYSSTDTVSPNERRSGKVSSPVTENSAAVAKSQGSKAGSSQGVTLLYTVDADGNLQASEALKRANANTLRRLDDASSNPQTKTQASRGGCESSGSSSESVDSIYAHGQKAIQDEHYPEALCLGQMVIDMGYKAGLVIQGTVYWNQGNGSAAFKAFKEAADAGDPFAAYWVSQCYLKSVGTVPDYEEYLRWLRIAMSDAEVRSNFVPDTSGQVAESDSRQANYERVRSGGIGTGCDADGHCVTRVPPRSPVLGPH